MQGIEMIRSFLGLDIKEKEYSYSVDPRFGYTQTRKIPDAWVKTTCGYCSVGCGILLGVKNGETMALRGDTDHPVNEGKLCPKGLSEHYTLKAKGRAQFPLLKDSAGQFQRIGWDDAFSAMVQKFKEIQTQHGAESLGVLSTGQLVSEEFYALGKLVQLGFKTPNYDGNTTLCMSSAVVGYKQSFGSDGPPGSYRGLETADVVFLIGANIADNHPILWHHLVKNKNRTFIVCDPRKSKTAMFSDIYLPIKPRSDIDLLNGLIHLVIRWGRVDTTFVEAHTTGFAELAKHSKKFTTDYVSQKTGLSEALIIQTAKAIVDAKNVFFGWTMGVNHSTQGSDTVSLINTLALITGNIGRTGAAPMSITGQCNAMGSREFSFSSSPPGYRQFESEKDRQDLARLMDINAEEMPQKRGLNYPQIIDGILDGKIKALWIIATNPLVSFPDYNRLKEAFQKLEFLVVQDGFHPTPPTQMADLILPAAIWGEKEGIYTNSERRASKVNKAVAPPGEAKSDFDIFLGLGQALGVKDLLFPGWMGPEDAFEEMKKISAGRLCDYSGMTYDRIEEKGGIQWPCNEDAPDGSDSLYTDGQFQTKNGKANLLFTTSEPLSETPDNTYRLLLNTGRTVEHWHTRTKTGGVEILEKLAPLPWVEINPETARYYAIDPQSKVDILSRRGKIENLLVRITETIQPWHVFIPFHFMEAAANKLTLPEFDPKSGEPNYKQCAVKIRKRP